MFCYKNKRNKRNRNKRNKRNYVNNIFVIISGVFLFINNEAIISAAFAAPLSPSANASSIVAVVGDEPITAFDLSARLKFVLATTNIESDSESVARLRPQILRVLIDERLQKQEAARNEIEVSDKEIEQAIAAIERQREMPPGTIKNKLLQNRIPENTLTDQIRAQILWSKLVSKKLRSQVRISDEDIAQMKRRLLTPELKQELKIAILQLPLDNPSRDKDVKKAADKLVIEARGGADFEELARQFSGGTAREGGKIATFWVRPEELDPFIAKVLSGAKAGTITEPLKNAAGYTIIKIYETRDIPGQETLGTEISFKEIVLSLRSSAEDKSMEKLKELAKEVVKNPGSCAEKTIGTSNAAELAKLEVNNITSMITDLPAALGVIAGGMNVGDISAPIVTEDKISLYMLCAKREAVKAVVTDERARAAVYQQRMELEAQKYMRNLRRDSFIEIR